MINGYCRNDYYVGKSGEGGYLLQCQFIHHESDIMLPRFEPEAAL
jgi:hypothetical protein